jgi:DNA-binding NarL/FixJ family response regulator
VLKALVVDDNTLTLRALTEQLAAAGEIHVVGWASSGADALLRADYFGPDLVVLDLQLGDMSGLDVARHLKRRAVPPFVAIVSVHDQREYAAAAGEAGADAFISKWEFDERLPELIERVMAYCEGRELPL